VLKSLVQFFSHDINKVILSHNNINSLPHMTSVWRLWAYPSSLETSYDIWTAVFADATKCVKILKQVDENNITYHEISSFDSMHPYHENLFNKTILSQRVLF